MLESGIVLEFHSISYLNLTQLVLIRAFYESSLSNSQVLELNSISFELNLSILYI